MILTYRAAVCDDYLSSHPASRDVFTATSLCDCIISMLESAGPDQNQEDLLNLLGIDSVETVFQTLQHRNELLQAPGESAEPPQPSSKSKSLSQRPIEDMGLDEDFLDQLKKQGLRLPNEPRGHDDRYKGYMLGVKLNHDVTMNERVSGQKTYHDVCLFWMFDDRRDTVFEGVTKFNRLQSWVFDCAYNTDNNMLVCAPTGAGKTNVALLTILHEIKKIMEEMGVIRREEMKIIYVAPMKALAQEIVAKFTGTLGRLGLIVRELTGDMQLTRQEIAETQVIVTTPEKWDVITRKGGDNSLVEKVKLLILDEVHLLASDRGNVIESITARTLRQVLSILTFLSSLDRVNTKVYSTCRSFCNAAQLHGCRRIPSCQLGARKGIVLLR